MIMHLAVLLIYPLTVSRCYKEELLTPQVETGPENKLKINHTAQHLGVRSNP